MRHALAILLMLYSSPVLGQCGPDYCPPTPWQSQFRQQIQRAALPIRPQNEPLREPRWMCEIEGGLGFHIGSGLVVTCYHGGHSTVTYQGREYPAQYVCGTPTQQGDIAVLKTVGVPFQSSVKLAKNGPPIGAKVCWQGGVGRVTRYDATTLHSSCRFRLGDSGGAVWTEQGVVSLVSATSSVDSIGPSTALLNQYVAKAVQITGLGKPQQPIPAQPTPEEENTTDTLELLDSIISRLEKLEQATKPGTEAGRSPEQTAAISVAISQSLATNQQFIESVRGERGPQGEQGPKGPQGEPGPIGPQGPPGVTESAELAALRQRVADLEALNETPLFYHRAVMLVTDAAGNVTNTIQLQPKTPVLRGGTLEYVGTPREGSITDSFRVTGK